MTHTDQAQPATNHTPGPWKVTHTQFGLHRIDCEERSKHGIGVVMSNVDTLPNARLIAAAPAQSIVLDLLRHGLATLSDGDLVLHDPMDGMVYAFDDACPDWTAVVDAIGWDKAIAVIARAKGTAA
jgi:hypothetical protein